MLKAIALNDYKTSVPLEDATRFRTTMQNHLKVLGAA